MFWGQTQHSICLRCCHIFLHHLVSSFVHFVFMMFFSCVFFILFMFIHIFHFYSYFSCFSYFPCLFIYLHIYSYFLIFLIEKNHCQSRPLQIYTTFWCCWIRCAFWQKTLTHVLERFPEIFFVCAKCTVAVFFFQMNKFNRYNLDSGLSLLRHGKHRQSSHLILIHHWADLWWVLQYNLWFAVNWNIFWPNQEF